MIICKYTCSGCGIVCDGLRTKEQQRYFCSKKCRSQHVSQTAICSKCGKEFLTYKLKPKKYCSLECQPTKPTHVFVDCICKNCGKEFQRKRGRFNDNKRKGENTYCSTKCSNIDHSISDELSPFRRFIHRIYYSRSRMSKRRQAFVLDCNLTLNDLKEVWDKQQGICPLSGQAMIIAPTSENTWENKKTAYSPYKASLDRIDNSKGYVKSNVRFVAYMANTARGTWSDEELIRFCRAVVENAEKTKKIENWSAPALTN